MQSLASLSRLRIRHCCELWCRLQIRRGSQVAMAVVSTAPIRHLAWEPPYAVSVALKRPKKKKDALGQGQTTAAPLLQPASENSVPGRTCLQPCDP